MSGAYLQFKTAYTYEELVEHFLLTPADLQRVVLTCRGESNRCGMALLLKSLTYLGYVPDSLDSVAREIRSFIAGHWDCSGTFPSNTSGTAERGSCTSSRSSGTRVGASRRSGRSAHAHC
jgi:hypothetical protein